MHHLFSESKIQTTCLVALSICAVTYLIGWLRPVLIPFVVSLVVVSGISPILGWLEQRLHVHRLIAAAITFVLGLVALCFLGLCLWASVMEIADEGDAYRQRVSDLAAQVQGIIEPFAAGLAEPAGRTSEEDELGNVANSTATQDSQLQLRRFLDGVLKTGITQLSAELFSLVSTSIVVLIYVFFLLLGSVDRHRMDPSIKAINEQVQSYLALKTVISIFTGLAFGITLWLFGVPMALTFGVMAFLLNYIPNIGPIVASLLPLPLIILQPDSSWFWMLSAFSAAMAVQVISGSLIEPKMMGDSSDLHPVTILLALMFWGMLWGITGMFLATPITAGIKLVLEAIPGAEPFAGILAGRMGSPANSQTEAVV